MRFCGKGNSKAGYQDEAEATEAAGFPRRSVFMGTARFDKGGKQLAQEAVSGFSGQHRLLANLGIKGPDDVPGPAADPINERSERPVLRAGRLVILLT